MHANITFKLENDANCTYYDAIVDEMKNKYHWYDDYGLLAGDVPNVSDEYICSSEAYKMFIGVVQNVATKYAQIIHIVELGITTNCLAQPYNINGKIEYMNFKQYEDITVKPMEQ